MATLPVPVSKKTERNKTKPWNIKQDYYDNGDEEELTITPLTGCQRLYRKQQQYNTEANKKLFNTSNNGGREETTEEDGC